MPDGTKLVTANRDGRIRLHDAGSLEVIQTLDGHSGELFAIAVDPETKRIISGADDGSICIWSEAGELQIVLKGHTGPVRSLSLSSNGKELASASDDGTVRIWDLKALFLPD